MSTKAYRKQVERSIAKVQTKRRQSTHAVTPDDLRRIVTNQKTAARTRVEALGRLMRLEGADVIPETAIQRLADPRESPVVRLAALKLLQQKQFFSSVAAEWRPAFIDALRSAVDDPKVRAAALEVLSAFKDRQTQQRLLDGIRHPKRALVPTAHALRLLSTDIHADVLDVARNLASDQQSRQNKPVFLQALRILGSDPASVGRLEDVLASNAHSIDARRLAATALSHLSPESLEPKTDKAVLTAKAKTKAAPKPKDALSRHIETLQRIRR
jgi:hypothetical protein